MRPSTTSWRLSSWPTRWECSSSGEAPTTSWCGKVMAGKSPAERAAELVAGTKLKDVAVRRKLFKGGLPAVEAAHDPMIELARLVDGPARRVRRTVEQQVTEPMQQAYAKLAKARFALQGNNVYPDATFTLRLAFGVVSGYKTVGEQFPPWTTLGGTYQPPPSTAAARLSPCPSDG